MRCRSPASGNWTARPSAPRSAAATGNHARRAAPALARADGAVAMRADCLRSCQRSGGSRVPGHQDEQPHGAAATAWPYGRPPFRADHVGSLLRPPELLRAREEFAAGRLSADRLRETEDSAIREVVRVQRDVGLRSATDGELRRESWHMDFIYQLGGIKKVKDDTIRVTFHNEQ